MKLRSEDRSASSGRPSDEMLNTDHEAEASFLLTFDARFPYNEPDASTVLIRQGASISLNAAFIVLYEICRPPRGAKVDKKRLCELVEEWEGSFSHPLQTPLVECAIALINHEPIPWREGVKLLEKIGQIDGQRAALGIAYFASDCSTDEGDLALDRADAIVRQMWDNQSRE